MPRAGNNDMEAPGPGAKPLTRDPLHPPDGEANHPSLPPATGPAAEAPPFSEPTSFGGASFGDTDWWVISRAGRPELPQADAARASLCETYWHSVYWFIRRTGQGHEDAQDLTQEFFARVLRLNCVHAAAREKGKFRTYLLTMLKRFLADEWDRLHRQKRGGGVAPLSLDGGNTEFFRLHEPADTRTPDKEFDRLWAESLLRQTFERLEQEYAAAGKPHLFAELKSYVTCDTDASCAATAQRLKMTVSNLKVTVHRLRQRYKELLRAEVARTATSEAEVEEELRDLYAALH
jgi:RNA polymerase sigma factor (sigma-70 family)